MPKQSIKDWDAEWSTHFNAVQASVDAIKPVITFGRRESGWYDVTAKWPFNQSSVAFETLEEAQQYAKGLLSC